VQDQQALDLLDRLAANVLRLGEQVNEERGLLVVLRERVQSRRVDLKGQRRADRFDKHRVRQRADKLFAATAEYFNEIVKSLTHTTS
jgi:hypothetical protein